MRYHYTPSDDYILPYGETYECDHPVYTKCTLFKIGSNGIAVIQQHYDPKTKHTYWTELDPWLPRDLYLNKGFYDYFKKRSGPQVNGLYPTVSVRQIMWALKMHPLKKEPWETTFDRQDI